MFKYWKKAFKNNVTEQNVGRRSHESKWSYNIGVRFWLLGHYYGLLETQLGEIQEVYEDYVMTTLDKKIECDVIIKCTGFEKNHAIKDILNTTHTYENGVVRENVMYMLKDIRQSWGIRHLLDHHI